MYSPMHSALCDDVLLLDSHLTLFAFVRPTFTLFCRVCPVRLVQPSSIRNLLHVVPGSRRPLPTIQNHARNAVTPVAAPRRTAVTNHRLATAYLICYNAVQLAV